MSIDLSVPIVQPIAVAETISATTTCLRQLLHQSDSVPVGMFLLNGKDRLEVRDGLMIPGKVYLVSAETEYEGTVELSVMNQLFEFAEIFPSAIGLASIAARRAGGSSLIAPMAAATAIAIASLQRTLVYDDARVWVDASSIAPEEFLRTMSVREAGLDLYSAATMFCKAMYCR